MERDFYGNTVIEALTNACSELCMTSDNLDFDVIDEGASGFMGFGQRKAHIVVRVVSEEKIEENKRLINQTIEDTIDLKENIYTSDTVPMKRIIKTLGLVSGSYAYNPLGLLGEGVGSESLLMQKAIEEATSNMIYNANSQANAIISVKTTTTQQALNNTVVTVTGQAVIVENIKEDEVSNVKTIDYTDELIKLKQLLDQGILTQEEFDAKKKQILGL